MQAAILAGGYGTRLSKDCDLAKYIPKTLLPINYKPIISYILNKIVLLSEIDKIYISIDQNSKPIFQLWHESIKYNKTIKLVDEPRRDKSQKLGAIGGLGYLIQQEGIPEDLLVIAGDNLFNGFDIAEFINFQRRKCSSVVACYDVLNKEIAKNKYGVLILDNNQRIIDFQEKPIEPKTSLISTACYILTKQSLKLLIKYLDDRNNPSDAPGHFIKWLSQRQATFGFIFTGKWFDLGDIDSYKQAEEHFS
ncbi:nucleotidyltransferase family protein [Chloroflexota bacterium]